MSECNQNLNLLGYKINLFYYFIHTKLITNHNHYPRHCIMIHNSNFILKYKSNDLEQVYFIHSRKYAWRVNAKYRLQNQIKVGIIECAPNVHFNFLYTNNYLKKLRWIFHFHKLKNIFSKFLTKIF